MGSDLRERLEELSAEATQGEWTALNMVHADGRPMTPQENVARLKMTDTQTPTYPTASGDKLTATRVPLGSLRFARRAVTIMGRDGYGNSAAIGQRYENVLQELCEVSGKKYWFDVPVESEIYD